ALALHDRGLGRGQRDRDRAGRAPAHGGAHARRAARVASRSAARDLRLIGGALSMDALHRIPQNRLEEAVARGELDRLPGAGAPLDLDDLARVPEDLRAGYLVLKNAGVLPEAMELRKEALRLGDLIAACSDASERSELESKRRAVLLRIEILRDR